MFLNRRTVWVIAWKTLRGHSATAASVLSLLMLVFNSWSSVLQPALNWTRGVLPSCSLAAQKHWESSSSSAGCLAQGGVKSIQYCMCICICCRSLSAMAVIENGFLCIIQSEADHFHAVTKSDDTATSLLSICSTTLLTDWIINDWLASLAFVWVVLIDVKCCVFWSSIQYWSALIFANFPI